MVNVVLKREYPKAYTSSYSTAVSNALIVGEILGQITIGLTCDYLGRKTAIILTFRRKHNITPPLLSCAPHASVPSGAASITTV